MKSCLIASLLFAVSLTVATTSDGGVSGSYTLRAKRDYQADPCLTAEEVNPKDVKFPSKFQELQRPWIREDGLQPRLYKSQGIHYQWFWIMSLIVKGVKRGVSVGDVLRFAESKNCMFLPFGSTVRDMVLRASPVWLSGEISCDIGEFYSECVKKYGPKACSLYPVESGGWGEYRLEIGDASVNSTTDQVRAEPISMYGWRSMLGQNPAKWGYSVDTMTIFDDGVGSLYLVDMTGHSFRDTCDKRLIAASDEKSWKEWSDNQLLKVMGFYELRSNGFSAASLEFQSFVNNDIKENYDRNTALTFYCEHILKGVINLASDEHKTPICHVVYPEKTITDKIGQMRRIMISEMGKSWNETIGFAGDELEAVYVTSSQYVDIRHRLKHRIQSDEPITTKQQPATLIEGKPMIKDMTDVHKRPILTMSAEPAKLPAEFPSLPNAQPNEKLEFNLINNDNPSGNPDPVAYDTSKEDVPIVVETRRDESDDGTMESGSGLYIKTDHEMKRKEFIVTVKTSTSNPVLVKHEYQVTFDVGKENGVILTEDVTDEEKFVAATAAAEFETKTTKKWTVLNDRVLQTEDGVEKFVDLDSTPIQDIIQATVDVIDYDSKEFDIETGKLAGSAATSSTFTAILVALFFFLGFGFGF